MNNQLVIMPPTGQPVTTSLIIAEGTQNQHKNVLELIRHYLNDLEEFGRVAFKTEPFETAGGTQKREIVYLTERQATLLLTLMRNSEIVVTFKKNLVKAFWQLAEQVAEQIAAKKAEMERLLTCPRSELLTMCAEVQKENEELTEKITYLEPKAKALDRIATANGSLTITDAAKNLRVKPKELVLWLQSKGWCYRRTHSSPMMGYQDKIDQGFLEHKVRTYTTADGVERLADQVRVTSKGMVKLSSLFSDTMDLFRAVSL